MTPGDVFDVLVVGGGHAGTEAALACARMGARTALLTHRPDSIGQMSCNPAIGGIGKSHLVREIDALGGVMARAADRAAIHLRVLNRSKGPAVRATRAQTDRTLYRHAVQHAVAAQPGLTVLAGAAADLAVQAGRCAGVVCEDGTRVHARAVVLTTGTFLAGVLHTGPDRRAGGRVGDPPAQRLAARLREITPGAGRLKTGTPPRLDGNTIDYTRLTAQPGDTPRPVMSLLGTPADHPRQVNCHITHTSARTHDIVRAALDRSPLYTGAITGSGPRYCPSIEDKVVRFAERDAHQIFLEPEGLDTAEVYPNGISTSLPADAQDALVHSIAGLERARLTRHGYAVEYDFYDPRGLSPWLETRALPGLYFAGQINGTTGYEEAAAQGLLAGINAVLALRDAPPWWPGREVAYLGVLVDDLTARGVTEPYRMFTSRAEHRLLLREDNADLRLTPTGRQLGLVDDARWAHFQARQEALARTRWVLEDTLLAPAVLGSLPGGAPAQPTRAIELLRRPDVSLRDLLAHLPGTDVFDDALVALIDSDVKYAGYVQRARAEIDRARDAEHVPVPADLDFAAIRGLSTEAAQKLAAARPVSVGQAARIPGVTPAAVSLLLVHLHRQRAAAAA